MENKDIIKKCNLRRISEAKSEDIMEENSDDLPIYINLKC